ncbi:MAG: hypothetical protein LLG42_09880 [Chloroflexi bacterium]|nr:hypothetical protein [Chloroflexota bacterium]
MKVIGFAGTAKNTGKTTAASRVLSALRDNGSRITITSIGYDGEDIDNVTGLPKPLYYLKAGDIIATATECLRPAKPSSYKILEGTDIQTILGEIQIVEILEDDTYRLAGPNRRTDLEQILRRFAAHRSDFSLIDGALNRIVPMICADGLVLSTGAAFDEDIQSTAFHVAAIAHIFTYKKIKNLEKRKNIHLQMGDGETITIRSSSLISEDIYGKIQAQIRAARVVTRLTIPGACYPELLERLLDDLPDNTVFRELVFGNPLYLIASGNPLVWKETLMKFEARGCNIGYSEMIPLLFITVSPFYPRYIHNSHIYEAAYVDAKLIQEEIKSKVSGLPVINIEEIHDPELLSLIS